MKPNDPQLFGVFLFEVGAVQFFTKLTSEEIKEGKDYNEIFWAHKDSQTVNGPFPSVHEAMLHYTGVIASEKKQPTGPGVNAPVIYVDFKTKQRVVHG